MGLANPAAFKPTPVFRESRKRGLTRLTIVTGSGDRQDIMVRDFSSRGFSAAAHGTAPAADEIVTVLLPDGRALWGIVRWVERNVFGVEFDVNTAPAEPTGGSSVAVR